MSKDLLKAAAEEQRLAALNGVEWDSGSEDGLTNDNVIPLEDIPKKAKHERKSSVDSMSNVIYVGHIPHGFYEDQMRGFFSQFGDVERVRLSRSKKTGGSKGYAFIEFKDAADTKIVAESMVSTVHSTIYSVSYFE